MNPDVILSLKNISTSNGSASILQDVNFELKRGEIHALVGNHRSGKSSLVRIISGADKKKKGQIFFDNREIEYFTPRTALDCGIIMLYQQLNILPSLNTIENIFASHHELKNFFSFHTRAYSRKALACLKELNADFDMYTPVGRLSIPDQHKVEIARVIAFDPKIIIVDEISSRLTPPEMEIIYPVLTKFKARGKSIIYITHNIDEIFEFADRVTILSSGKILGSEKTTDIDKIKLINLTYSYVIDREEYLKERKEIHYYKNYNETIIQNIPAGVMILDSEQNIYMTNLAVREIFHIEENSFTGKTVDFIFSDKKLEQKEQILEKIQSREELFLDEITFEDDKYLKIAVLPFKDENYIYCGTIIIVEDISKEKYLKDYLLRLEKLSSIAELASGVAHEINNPLGIISNYIVLMKDKNLDTDSREKLVKIEKEVKSMVEIVSSLLSFSKINAPSRGKVDLKSVVNEVFLLLEHMIKEKAVKVIHEAPENEYPVNGEATHLKQLCMNLAINSLDAVDEGGTIVFSLEKGESFIQAQIKDNGCGISAEVQAKMFDPFFSTKTKKKNAGLGLSICQHIVENHDGIISCKSNPGQYTCFTFRFPIYQELTY